MTGADGRVSVVGGANLDVIVTCEGHVRDDATLEAKAIAELPGGHAANVAVWAAANGTPSSIHAAVGGDATGEDLVDQLRSWQVDVSGVHRITSEPTGRAFVVNSPGAHFMVLHRGANQHLASSWTDQDTAAVATATCVVLMDCPTEVSDHVLRRLAALPTGDRPAVVLSPGGRTAATMNWVRPWAARLPLRVICNKEEATRLDGATVDDYLAGGGTLIITSGKHGVEAITATGSRHTAARPSVSIDPTGAGDAFTAAYAGVLATGGSCEDACARGVASGARAVESMGAWPVR